jgi:hypothetical protein
VATDQPDLARGEHACAASPSDGARRRSGAPDAFGAVVRRCRSCGRPLYGRGSVCRCRRCPEYSHVSAGDQRQKLFCNLEVLPGDILLSAVTAPGSDCLPWNEPVCAGLGEHKHSGKLGCRVQESAAARWNREAPGRWRRLHRRAYQDTVKRFGRGSVFLATRVWEIARSSCPRIRDGATDGRCTRMRNADSRMAGGKI